MLRSIFSGSSTSTNVRARPQSRSPQWVGHNLSPADQAKTNGGQSAMHLESNDSNLVPTTPLDVISHILS
jgi:hypothetical protein